MKTIIMIMAVMALVSSGCQPAVDPSQPDPIKSTYGDSKIELMFRGIDIMTYKVKGTTPEGRQCEKIITVNLETGEIHESAEITW